MRVFLNGICRRATKSQKLRTWADDGDWGTFEVWRCRSIIWEGGWGSWIGKMMMATFAEDKLSIEFRDGHAKYLDELAEFKRSNPLRWTGGTQYRSRKYSTVKRGIQADSYYLKYTALLVHLDDFWICGFLRIRFSSPSRPSPSIGTQLTVEVQCWYKAASYDY